MAACSLFMCDTTHALYSVHCTMACLVRFQIPPNTFAFLTTPCLVSKPGFNMSNDRTKFFIPSCLRVAAASSYAVARLDDTTVVVGQVPPSVRAAQW